MSVAVLALVAAAASVPAPPSTDVETVADHLDAYWSATLPTLGDASLGRPPSVVTFDPAGPAAPPGCNGRIADPSFFVDNAFYCRVEDRIVLDAALTEDPATLLAVVAHEYGHAVQDRLRIGGETVDLELQADCLAGAALVALPPARSSGRARQVRDLFAAAPPYDAAPSDGHTRLAAYDAGRREGAGACLR